MVDPLTTATAMYAAHRTFHAAHPHICGMTHKAVSHGAGPVSRYLYKGVSSRLALWQSRRQSNYGNLDGNYRKSNYSFPSTPRTNHNPNNYSRRPNLYNDRQAAERRQRDYEIYRRNCDFDHRMLRHQERTGQALYWGD
jgi:hypothetical protein